MNTDIKKTSTISLKVGLNEGNVPVKIEWESDGNPNGNDIKPCKGMLLSVFDETSKETYKIDLWTNEMQVVEMDRFMFQTIRGLADTYFKATQNKELANAFQQFVHYFGEQTKIIPSEK